MASTMPNRVSTLIEKPSTSIAPQVPARAMGTTRLGIRVARQLRRNASMTRNTRAMASSRV